MALLNFFQQFFLKRLVQIWNDQKWPFWIFSDNFSQKDWYKLGMAKNGCSKFFLTIFPKKTGTNLKWPKMAIPNFSDNFSQKDWYKFGMTKNGCSKFFLKGLVQIWNGKWPFQIFSDIFSQKDWYKFRMAKHSHSEFFWQFENKFQKFSEVHVKNNEFHILNTNLKITAGHFRLGWTFEPRPIWPCWPFQTFTTKSEFSQTILQWLEFF